MLSSSARALFQSKKCSLATLSDAQLEEEIECCVKNTPWHYQLDGEVNRRLRAAEDEVQQKYAMA